MLPQVDDDKLIQTQLQLFLNEKLFIILYSYCYNIQLLQEDYSLKITNTELRTEMLFQAMCVNMLILKVHFHLFWTHNSMNCTHVCDIANHFIFEIAPWIFRGSWLMIMIIYFTKYLPEIVWIIWELDFFTRLPHFQTYF